MEGKREGREGVWETHGEGARAWGALLGGTSGVRQSTEQRLGRNSATHRISASGVAALLERRGSGSHGGHRDSGGPREAGRRCSAAAAARRGGVENSSRKPPEQSGQETEPWAETLTKQEQR
ncbi:pollen-specific leucine-rich repeat extensin-like protein 4 [Iris pallida]|uniref:Pollen-specific leucine-rich repeat extensin-like protein 4 n=1 Tax=Iris pallida TaxID=29817 RepID=A0AAX6DS19_IRIPA|nr:pollen-specific leucine-rich repeat extensin-like protein 4 [Iris pallida]